MEQQSSPVSHSLKWGIILGIFLVIYTLLLYILDLSTNKALGWISFVILIAGTYICVKNYRDKINNGYINFGSAFVTGFLIIVFAGVISSIYSYFHFKFIAPELIDKMLQLTEEKLLEKGLTEDMVEMQINMSRKFMSPAIMSVISVFTTAIIGAIVSLIIAAILKKEQNPFTKQE